MEKYFRRTWVEVDLDALRFNYGKIKEIVSPGSRIMAVVKADAYGHGVENVVKSLSEEGCDFFAVSNLEEALQVRGVNGEAGILILGYTPPEYAAVLAVNNISQSLFNLDYAKKLSLEAVKHNLEVPCHIKVDTGMGRLGFVFHDSLRDINAVEQAKEAATLPGIYIEGAFTHFSSADEEGEGENYTAAQYDLFTAFTAALEFEGVHIPYKHCCNSAATVLHPEMHLDMVRPGVILYGLMPSDFLKGKIDLKPVLSLKSIISMCKELEEGTPVSYGRKFVTDKKMKIATVPVGYADGYPRLLSGKAQIRVGGKAVPVLGNICMDQCMIDVTGLEAQEGMTVTVFDNDSGSPLSLDALAKTTGTINYEIACGINKRVPRVYKSGGEIVAIADYMV